MVKTKNAKLNHICKTALFIIILIYTCYLPHGIVMNKDDGYLAANHGSFIKMYRKAAENLEGIANKHFA